MRLFTLGKKCLHALGYDIKKHHDFYKDVLEPLKIQTIFDIGANDGNYALEMLERFPKATIYAFEPLAECFTRLEAKAQQHPTISAFNFALGAHNETTTIQRSSFHPSSSLLTMNSLHKELYPKSKNSSEETIEVKRLDDYALSLTITDPLFIKMDVQGYESEVIRGGRDTITQAAVLLVENAYTAFYDNQPLAADIIAQLHELGFNYFGAAHTHYHRDSGVPLYEDSIFIRADIAKEIASQK